MQAEPRDLSSTSTAAAAATTSDLVVTGNPDGWKLVWKTSSRSSASMFSIKHHEGRSILQFSWKLGAEVCETLVAIDAGCALVPNSNDLAWQIVRPSDGAADLVNSSTALFHSLECAAESRTLGFRKSTLLFVVRRSEQSKHVFGTIVLAMTEERGKIAMSAVSMCC